MHAHYLFDGLGWSLGFLAGWLASRMLRVQAGTPPKSTYTLGYVAAMMVGAVIGAFGLGTLNIIISGGWPAIGRSIVGGLFGAIVFIEIFKYFQKMRGSTGVMFVAAFSVGVAVGRIGCFLMGLDDFTYGTETRLPWGVDFGDGISRHPVQLYESLVMGGFALAFFAGLKRQSHWAVREGFYWMVLVYAGQRFVWEFLKPYGGLEITGGLTLNIFHLITSSLCVYALVMLRKSKRG